jgi:hypothetical protein
MELKDKNLKEIYQTSIQEHKPPKNGCPAIEVLIQSFTDGMAEHDKIKIVDHISACGSCYGKFEAVRQILRESKKMSTQLDGLSLSEIEVEELKKRAHERIRELETAGKSRGKFSFVEKLVSLFNTKPSIKYATALTGVFIIAIVFLFVLRIPQNLRESTLRGEKKESVLQIFPKGELKELPVNFAWKSLSGAREYQVLLLDEELTKIWDSEKTQKTEMPIPYEVQNRMMKDRIYYWKVVIYFEDGTKKETDLQEFKLSKNQ